MQLLKKRGKVLLSEQGVEEALEEDEGQPLVQHGVLDHVEEHLQAGARRLRADGVLEVLREAGEEGDLGRDASAHLPVLLARGPVLGGEAIRPEALLDGLKVRAQGHRRGQVGEILDYPPVHNVA